jgi:cytochrome P450
VRGTAIEPAPVAIDEMPGPPGNPLLGMGLAFRRDVLVTLLSGFQLYGDVVAYRFGPRRGPLHQVVVAAHHPEQVRRVLTESERTFGKRTVGFEVLTDMLGRGLLTAEGELWRQRTLAPLFTRAGSSGMPS